MRLARGGSQARGAAGTCSWPPFPARRPVDHPEPLGLKEGMGVSQPQGGRSKLGGPPGRAAIATRLLRSMRVGAVLLFCSCLARCVGGGSVVSFAATGHVVDDRYVSAVLDPSSLAFGGERGREQFSDPRGGGATDLGSARLRRFAKLLSPALIATPRRPTAGLRALSPSPPRLP